MNGRTLRIHRDSPLGPEVPSYTVLPAQLAIVSDELRDPQICISDFGESCPHLSLTSPISSDFSQIVDQIRRVLQTSKKAPKLVVYLICQRIFQSIRNLSTLTLPTSVHDQISHYPQHIFGPETNRILEKAHQHRRIRTRPPVYPLPKWEFGVLSIHIHRRHE